MPRDNARVARHLNARGGKERRGKFDIQLRAPCSAMKYSADTRVHSQPRESRAEPTRVPEREGICSVAFARGICPFFFTVARRKQKDLHMNTCAHTRTHRHMHVTCTGSRGAANNPLSLSLTFFTFQFKAPVYVTCPQKWFEFYHSKKKKVFTSSHFF